MNTTKLGLMLCVVMVVAPALWYQPNLGPNGQPTPPLRLVPKALEGF